MNLFLIILTGIYLLIASIQDLRKREVWNWLSFSLIAFALVYRAFYAVLNNDLWFFLFGVFGLIGFVILGYAFYYARVFAGGDAKLLFAVGACLPLSNSITGNLISLGVFILLLLFLGGLWGLFYSFFLAFKNGEKFFREFKIQTKKIRMFVYLAIFCFVVLMGFASYLGEIILFVIPLIILLLPVLYIYGKAIENSCMIKMVSSRELTVGDWLVSSVHVGKKIVKPDWEGISEEELKILRKCRGKVKIKVGVPFVPGFLIAFLVWAYLISFRLTTF